MQAEKLQVQIISGDNLVFLYDTETAFMEFVHKEDTEHKIWLHKKNGIQIIRSKWYKPKCDKNLISCKRGWFYSNKYSFKIEISVMQADEMTVRKPGVLCFSDLDAGFSLVMEDGLRKLRYVFVDKNGKILKEMPSSKNYCPMEAYLVKECKCLLLMYAKKTYLFSYQNLEFKLKKAIGTTFASAPPLYFKETRQLLILDVEKGKWVDMEE